MKKREFAEPLFQFLMSRPEHQAPPDIFYNQQEARKYSLNSRVAAIQTQMTLRALQLLNLPGDKALLLDIGCGSGLSGQVIEVYAHSFLFTFHSTLFILLFTCFLFV